MVNSQLEPEPPPITTTGTLYDMEPERTPEPAPFDNLSKGMTPKNINAMTRELQRLREELAKFQERESRMLYSTQFS